VLIDLYTAKAHVRDEDAEDYQVEPYLNAAILSASTFLNRRIYASDAELAAAIAATPAAVTAALAALDTSVAAASAETDWRVALDVRESADLAYRRAMSAVREIREGIVVNGLIQAGILLIFGHLYANREDVVAGATVADLPQGSKHLLQPYRVGLGV
jgi:hypothetical protein